MQVFLVIELALLALFVVKAGLADIERDLVRQPCPSKRDDTDCEPDFDVL
jgi:hypothetical protein